MTSTTDAQGVSVMDCLAAILDRATPGDLDTIDAHIKRLEDNVARFRTARHLLARILAPADDVPDDVPVAEVQAEVLPPGKSLPPAAPAWEASSGDYRESGNYHEEPTAQRDPSTPRQLPTFPPVPTPIAASREARALANQRRLTMARLLLEHGPLTSKDFVTVFSIEPVAVYRLLEHRWFTTSKQPDGKVLVSLTQRGRTDLENNLPA